MADREAELEGQIKAVMARVRVLEFALLALLESLPRRSAQSLADGLRARANAWALEAGPELTVRTDELVSEQLASLLSVLDDAPALNSSS